MTGKYGSWERETMTESLNIRTAMCLAHGVVYRFPLQLTACGLRPCTELEFTCLKTMYRRDWRGMPVGHKDGAVYILEPSGKLTKLMEASRSRIIQA